MDIYIFLSKEEKRIVKQRNKVNMVWYSRRKEINKNIIMINRIYYVLFGILAREEKHIIKEKK